MRPMSFSFDPPSKELDRWGTRSLGTPSTAPYWLLKTNNKGRAADTCWATCHFGTQEGQERHLCSLKLDGRLLLPLLPNRFPILFQRDIGVRRPACVGVRWTLERKTRSSLNEMMWGVLRHQFHNGLLEWVLLICTESDAYALCLIALM